MDRVSASIDFHELREYIATQNILESQYKNILKNVILEVSNTIIEKTKLKTPVDTGALRSAWGIKSSNLSENRTLLKSESYQKRYGKKKMVERIVYRHSGQEEVNTTLRSVSVTLTNPQEYASFIENGFTKPNGGWYEGRQMLRRSINEVLPRIQSVYNVTFNNFKVKEGLS